MAKQKPSRRAKPEAESESEKPSLDPSTAADESIQSGKRPGELRNNRKPKKIPALSEAQLADLLALPDGYPRRPDSSSERLLCESREAIDLAVKHKAKLFKKARLDKSIIDTLKARREALRVAEHAVRGNLDRTSSRAHAQLRKEGRRLVSDCVAALDYFAKSAKVEEGLATVTRGDEDQLLIEDLRTCAQLVDQAGDALARSDLPKGASDKCRASAIELSQTSQATTEPSPFDHVPVRNRAYWYLRDAVSAVAAAGCYVFRDDPKRLLAFTALR